MKGKVKNKEMVERLNRKFRESGCSTQGEFAERLGVSRQTLGHWLNGERAPDADNLKDICDTMGVTVDWLLGKDPLEKQSADNELRFVCEYTGLSEKAISLLRQLSPGTYEGDDKKAIYFRQRLNETLCFCLSDIEFFQYIFESAADALESIRAAEKAGLAEPLSNDDVAFLNEKLYPKGWRVQTADEVMENFIAKAVNRTSSYWTNLSLRDAIPKLKEQREQREALFLRSYGIEEA